MNNIENIYKKTSNSFTTVLEIYKYLNKKRRLQIIISLILTIIAAVFEIFSIAIILPFLTLLTNPSALNDYPIISSFYNYFSFYNPNIFIVFITSSFILITIFSLIIKLFNLRYSIDLGENIGADLCKDAFEIYLSKSYSFLKCINSSDIISDINKNIAGSIMAIDSLLKLISSLVLSLAIFTALLIIDSNITILTSLILISSYLFINKYSKDKLITNSKRIVDLQPLQLKYLQESLGGIREVILSNLKDYYTFNFEKVDRKIRSYLANSGFITNSFRYIIEAVVLIIICGVTLSFLYLGKLNSSSFAILGTFAIGAQKLLPSLQTIFRMWSNIRSKKFEVLKTINILESHTKPVKFDFNNNINFQERINLKNISFRFPNTENYVLRNINLQIKKGDCLGIMGESGSGKSTFADILMTLLIPSIGEYHIDNLNIYESDDDSNILEWRRSIAQVPQKIFLADTTIAENIAFGSDKDKIDMTRLRECAQLSSIESFIESLPMKYETIVGESGAFLSGGQIQRMAIARALYKGAKLLIFDEATSALDEKTEEKIMNSIKRIKGKVTIVFISHKIKTLEICDEIIEIKNGLIRKI